MKKVRLWDGVKSENPKEGHDNPAAKAWWRLSGFKLQKTPDFGQLDSVQEYISSQQVDEKLF